MYNNKKNKILFLLFSQILLLITFITSCSKAAPEFVSKETLAERAINLINNGKAELLLKTTIQKDEYIRDYYPHLPEAKMPGSLSGEEFYRTFVGLQKINAVKGTIKQYQNKIISIKAVGEPEHIIKTDTFNILRKIPVTMIIKDINQQEIEITDNRILGIVVEKNNKYKLMNILR